MAFWNDGHGNETHYLMQMTKKNASFKPMKFVIK